MRESSMMRFLVVFNDISGRKHGDDAVRVHRMYLPFFSFSLRIYNFSFLQRLYLSSISYLRAPVNDLLGVPRISELSKAR
jgi:hypothetical protein